MNITTLIAFTIGFFIGGNFGLFIACLVMYGKDENF